MPQKRTYFLGYLFQGLTASIKYRTVHLELGVNNTFSVSTSHEHCIKGSKGTMFSLLNQATYTQNKVTFLVSPEAGMDRTKTNQCDMGLLPPPLLRETPEQKPSWYNTPGQCSGWTASNGLSPPPTTPWGAAEALCGAEPVLCLGKPQPRYAPGNVSNRVCACVCACPTLMGGEL